MWSVNVYGLGGCGTNLVSELSQYDEAEEEGFAKYSLFYADTADSNLSDKVPADKVYMVGANKGSGKIKAENAQNIVDGLEVMTARQKPTDFNILVFSLSGGSGSMYGPALTHAILENPDNNVIVIGIGSMADRMEARNTLTTLTNLDMIAQELGRPVPIYYLENDPNKHYKEVDVNVHRTLLLLQVALSGQNKSLDHNDVKHFLDYHKGLSVDPMAVSLKYFSNEVELGREEAPITLLSLTDEDTPIGLPVKVGYRTSGVITEPATKSLQDKLPVHFTLSSGHLNEVKKKLEDIIAEYDEAERKVVKKAISSDTSKAKRIGNLLI